MTVFDVFDTAPAAALSGSMSSNVIVGSSLTASITNALTIYNTNRVLIGDKWSGIAPSALTNSRFPKWRYSDFYSFASGRRANGTNIFLTCQEMGRIYLDSIMPDIVAVASLNGEYIYSGSAFKGDLDLQAPGFPVNRAGTVIVRRTSQWLQAFPFQTKYKNLGRQLQQGRLLSVVTGSATSLGGVTFEDTSGDIFTIADASSSNPATDFAAGTLPTTFEDQAAILLLLPMELTRKTFFCFGDGLEPKTVGFDSATAARYRQLPGYTLRYFPDPDFLAAPVFRGFRYGALNANPVTPNFTFRRNHFGHHSDLVASPPHSAFSEGSAITYAVDVTFLSGTSVYASASLYASASSPTTFNAYDSGIFDLHARAGQPFFDRGGSD